MSGFDVVICSPPYSDAINSQQHGIDWTKVGPATGNRKRGEGTKHEETLQAQLSYGATPGQLGAMPAGSFPFTEDTMNKETQRDCVSHEWQGCYDDSWRGLIVADAFAH